VSRIVTPSPDTQGVVYLICFARPFGHARHYLGFVDTTRHSAEEALASRLAYHRSGQGSRLLRAVANAGITFEVVRTWSGATRSDERRLKCQSSTPYCPVCSGEVAFRRGTLQKPKRARKGAKVASEPPGTVVVAA
jgi:hypothetical protein